MATKKHHHKKSKGVTRRRVGATGSGGFMGEAEWLLGLGAGQLVATAAQRQLVHFDPKIVSGLEIGGGIFMRHRFPGAIMQGVSAGIAGAGIMGIAHEFGVLKGMDTFCDKLFDREHNPQKEVKQISMPMPGQQITPEHVQAAKEILTAAKTSGMSNYDTLSGIANYDMLSGMSNFDMLSGNEAEHGIDGGYAQEYQSVESLGM